jgi:hypothetical protein
MNKTNYTPEALKKFWNSAEFTIDPPKAATGQDYIDEAAILSEQLDKDLLTVSNSYGEYVTAVERREADKTKLQETFQADIASLLSRMQTQMTKTADRIYKLRYPLLSSANAQDKLQGTMEYNTAVHIVSHLSQEEYPLNQVRAFFAAGRYDAASALIDESLNRLTNGLEAVQKRTAFEKTVNEFYRSIGVADLQVQQLELETAEEIIAGIVKSRTNLLPQDKILAGMNQNTILSNYRAALAKLQS